MEAQMAKDPICGMDVDEKDAQFMTHIGHETYYFCSKACCESFEIKEGLRKEGEGKGRLRAALERFLKGPKEKPPRCH